MIKNEKKNPHRQIMIFLLLSILLSVVVVALCALVVRQRVSQKRFSVPFAAPCAPILGSALAFRNDARSFLAINAAALGRNFAVDLCGFHVVLLSDLVTIRDYFKQPETVLSSYDSLCDIGEVEEHCLARVDKTASTTMFFRL